MTLAVANEPVVIEGLRGGYSIQSGPLADAYRNIINGVSLRIRPGEIVGLIGPNGSGKTTLIRAIVDPASRVGGTVCCAREPVRPGQIAYVPQAASSTLSPWLRAADEITLPRRVGQEDRRRRQPAAAALSRQFGLSVPLNRKVGELSGGQKIKVALLRALAIRDVRLAVLDEPFEGLDEQARSMLMSAIKRLAATGTPVIITSHRRADLEELGARRLALDGQPVTGLVEEPASTSSRKTEKVPDGSAGMASASGLRRPAGEDGTVLLPLLGFIVGLILWAVLSRLVGDPRLLPPPWSVGREMLGFVTTADGLGNLSATAMRTLGCWSLAIALAIPAGILVGYSSRFFRLVSVWLSVARCLPIFALVGVARGLFPGFDGLQVAFLIWLTLFVVALQAVSIAAALAPRRRMETARIFGASRWFVLTRIMPFESITGILAAMEITLPLGVIVTIVVESFTFPPHGLGLDIYNNMDRPDASKLFAAILLPATVAAAGMWLVRRMGHRWRFDLL